MVERRKTNEIAFTRTIHGHRIPFYDMVIHSGERLQVPRHIRRLHSGALKGWQIVIRRKGIANLTRLVSDSGDSPEQSLDRAVSELARVLRDVPAQANTQLKIRENKRKRIRTGVPGVSLTWRMHNVRGIYQLYVMARAGEFDSARAKSWYVGTENTLTEARIRARLSQAVQLRRRFFENEIALGRRNPYRRAGQSRPFGVSLAEIDQELAATKKRDHPRLCEMVEDRINMIRRGRWINSWAGTMLNNRPVEIEGHRLHLPDIIDVDGANWCVEVTLSNGSVYGDSIEMGDEPLESVLTLLYETMEAMVLACPSLVERERVHGFRPRQTQQGKNQSA